MNGVDATRQIRSFQPDTEVLIFTMHGSEPLIRELLEAGARGYLLKSDARASSSRRSRPSPDTSRSSPDGSRRRCWRRTSQQQPRRADALSSRERNVLQLIVEGRTNKEWRSFSPST